MKELKPSERIGRYASITSWNRLLEYLDEQAADNAGKSPGIATASGSCHCERDGLLPGEGHAVGCPSGEHSKGLMVPDLEFADPAVDVCYCGAKESEHTEAMGHGFLRAISSPREVEALGHIKWLADFAYQHGAHELGYDPVKQVARSLATLADQLTLCAKEVNELVSSNDEAQLLYVQMEKAWESASKQREELRAELSQLKTELALSTESDLRITRKHNALEVELAGFRYNMEAVLFGSRDEHSLDEMVEKASQLTVAVAPPSGEVAAPSPVAPTCVRRDGPVESKRWVYALPTCYACLPPPPPIPLLTDADFPKRAEQAPRPHPDRCKCDGLYVGGICTRCGLSWSPEQAEATPPEPEKSPRRVAPEGEANAPLDRLNLATDTDIIRAAEGVTLEPGEYEVMEIAARDEDPGLTIGQRFTLRYSLEPLSRTGERIWGTRHTLLTAVRRVALTEPEPVPESGSQCAWCGETRTICARGKQCDKRALARIVDSTIRHERDQRMLTWRQARIDELSAEHVRDQLLIGLGKGRIENVTKERDKLRSTVSELEATLRGLATGDAEIDLLTDACKTNESLRSTLTATEAKLEHQENRVALRDAALDVASADLATRDAELARVRGELADEQRALTQLWCDITNAWGNYSGDHGDLSDFAREIRQLAECNPRAATETPAVAAPAVVQREIVIGSTWENKAYPGITCEVLRVLSDGVDFREGIVGNTGKSRSELSTDGFREFWRHVSDPAPPTAIPRGTTLKVGRWYRITEIADDDDTPAHLLGDLVRCAGMNAQAGVNWDSIDARPNCDGYWFAASKLQGGTYVTGLELVPGPDAKKEGA